MKQIVVEPALEEALPKTSGQVLLCNAQGRAIGMFSPFPNQPAVSELQLEPPLSIEETEELRKKNRTGKPLEEILARLGL
jgi:hypothetical protein